MIERRVRIPKGYGAFVHSLTVGEGSKGATSTQAFRTHADVLAFAAALAASLDRWEAVTEFETSPEPIRQSVFANKKYVVLFNLLAVNHTGRPDILAASDEMEKERIGIFEGYAYMGLKELKSIVGEAPSNSLMSLSLFLNKELATDDAEATGIFDFSSLLKN